MQDVAVLVVAKHAVIAALLGMLLEYVGHRPLFPEPDEAPTDALRRLSPRLLLLDCDHDAACDDEAYAVAAGVGAAVLLFSSRGRAEVERVAAQRQARAFALPIGRRAFAQTVADALAA